MTGSRRPYMWYHLPDGPWGTRYSYLAHRIDIWAAGRLAVQLTPLSRRLLRPVEIP
jgi:hypothetical protein